MRRISLQKAPFLVFTLTLVMAGTIFERSVGAAELVPFRASFTTEFSSVVAFPIIHVTVDGEGDALHMGRTQASTTNQAIDVITGIGTATYTLTGANGDTVVVQMTLNTVFSSSTQVSFAGPFDLIGGTGRFSGATGSGSVEGSATFTGASDGVGEFTLDGVISRSGRN